LQLKYLPPLLTCVALLATVPAGSLGAQPVPTTSGETRVAAITTNRFSDRDVVDGVQIIMRWRFGVLMGEPLQEFSGVYMLPQPVNRSARLVGTRVCSRAPGAAELRPVRGDAIVRPFGLGAGGVAPEIFEEAGPRSHSLFRATIALPHGFGLKHAVPVGSRVFIDFRPDTLVPEGSAAAYLAVPSSPSWREAFQVRPGAGPAYFLSEAGAKALYREGVRVESIEAIDPRFATIDLRLAHERRVREVCGSSMAAQSDAAADTQQSPANDPVAVRMAAALGRAREADEARRQAEVSAALEAERAAIAQRHSEAQQACEAGAPGAPVRGVQRFYLCEGSDWNSPCEQGRRAEDRRLLQEYREARDRYEQNLQRWNEEELPTCLSRADAARDTELTRLETRERERARIASGQLRGGGTGVDR